MAQQTEAGLRSEERTASQILLGAALSEAEPSEAEYRLALREMPTHRVEALTVLRRHPDWDTPNFCTKCSPAGFGYCRCEIACNE